MHGASMRGLPLLLRTWGQAHARQWHLPCAAAWPEAPPPGADTTRWRPRFVPHKPSTLRPASRCAVSWLLRTASRRGGGPLHTHAARVTGSP
jgi:hypothetical protein